MYFVVSVFDRYSGILNIEIHGVVYFYGPSVYEMWPLKKYCFCGLTVGWCQTSKMLHFIPKMDRLQSITGHVQLNNVQRAKYILDTTRAYFFRKHLGTAHPRWEALTWRPESTRSLAFITNLLATKAQQEQTNVAGDGTPHHVGARARCARDGDGAAHSVSICQCSGGHVRR